MPLPRETPVEPQKKTSPPPATVPLEGRTVSLPAKIAPKYTYSAYGEEPGRANSSNNGTVVVKGK